MRDSIRRERRDWASAEPRALGPSVEGGSYRAALTRPAHPAERWWTCTGHPPHVTEEETLGCARAARQRLAEEES